MLNIPVRGCRPSARTPHLWRFLLYQPFVASIGVPLQRRTPYLERVIFGMAAPGVDRQAAKVYADAFRDPMVARTARDTYRTFLLREARESARNPERRRSTVPTRALFARNDTAIHASLAAAETARADDYTGISSRRWALHSRQPELVRAKLVALANEVPAR